MIALLTACLFFFSILVRALNCISKARAKTVFGHLKSFNKQVIIWKLKQLRIYTTHDI